MIHILKPDNGFLRKNHEIPGRLVNHTPNIHADLGQSGNLAQNDGRIGKELLNDKKNNA